MPTLNLTNMENNVLTIEELEIFFQTAKLPQEIQLYEGVRVVDVPRFLQNHIAIFKNNSNARVFDVFLVRLMRLRELLLQPPE